MRLIFIVSLLTFIVRDVRCYIFPISQDTGKALEGIISTIKSVVPKCLDFFQPIIEPEPEPTLWAKITQMIGYKKDQEIESIEEPLLLCNSFVLLILALTLVIYFSLSRHMIMALKKKKPETVPFLCDDDDDETEAGSDVDSSLHFARSCGKCNCPRFLLARGDNR